MTLLDIAKKNVARAWRTYVLHFVNSAFAVLAFFLFTCLALHPEMGRAAVDSTIGLVSASSGVVVAVFSLGFISYSESCFLRARSRQFGLLAMSGASKRQLRRIVLAENMIIGLCAVCAGVVLGTAFLKLFLAAAGKAMGTVEFGFYLPLKPAAATAAAFLVVFVVSGFFGARGLAKKEVKDLLCADQASSQAPSFKVSVAEVLVCAAVFVLGMVMSRHDAGLMWSFAFLLGGVGVIASGTHLLFHCLFSGILARRKATGSYYEGISMLKEAAFRESLKGNLQSMTVTAVLCSFSFFALVWLFTLSDNALEKTQEIIPSPVTYITWNADVPVAEHEAQIDAALAGRQGVGKAEFAYSRVDDRKNVVMSESSYNAVAAVSGRQTVTLESGQALLLPGMQNVVPTGVPAAVVDTLGDLDVTQGTWLIIPDGCAASVTVLSDSDYRAGGFGYGETKALAYTYDGWEDDASLRSEVPGVMQSVENRDVSLFFAQEYYETDRVQYSLLLYLGSILGISFLLASASLAYSRLHARSAEEGERMRPIVKLGLSRSGLAKVCRSVSLRVLALPLGVSLVYLWIGIAIVVSLAHVALVVPAIWFTLVAFVVGAVCCAAAARSYASSVIKTAFGEQAR